MFLEHIMHRVVSLRGRDLFSKSSKTANYSLLAKEYRVCKNLPLSERMKQMLLYYFPLITYSKIKLGEMISSSRGKK
jgi:hypothetical protein